MGYWRELEIYRCADGCQKLATEIEKDIKTKKPHLPSTVPAEVLVRRAVTRIELEKPHDGKPISVTSKPVWIDADGTVNFGVPRVQGFDHVVFAIPPSVWSGVEFDSKALHPSTLVKEMEMGDAVKFFTNMTQRFWIRDGEAPYGSAEGLGQVWEGTDNQTRVAGQGIVLSVFAGGPKALRTATAFTAGLKKLFPRYPAFISKRRPHLLANWPAQPFIKAGFTAPGIGQVFDVGRKLNRSFRDRGRLFFAGEHTQMNHFGYMEGALRSGERAAHDLIRLACGLPTPVPATPRGGEPVLVASNSNAGELEEATLSVMEDEQPEPSTVS
jgi:monoamine oxidase